MSRSKVPGTRICLYLKAEDLRRLAHIHARPAEALRILIGRLNGPQEPQNTDQRHSTIRDYFDQTP